MNHYDHRWRTNGQGHNIFNLIFAENKCRTRDSNLRTQGWDKINAPQGKLSRWSSKDIDAQFLASFENRSFTIYWDIALTTLLILVHLPRYLINALRRGTIFSCESDSVAQKKISHEMKFVCLFCFNSKFMFSFLIYHSPCYNSDNVSCQKWLDIF